MADKEPTKDQPEEKATTSSVVKTVNSPEAIEPKKPAPAATTTATKEEREPAATAAAATTTAGESSTTGASGDGADAGNDETSSPPAPAPTAAVAPQLPQVEGLMDPSHWGNVANENLVADDDSALGTDDEESTASISSSILQYRTINGRTYHAERGNAQYWAANDMQANEALDVLHHTATLTMDGKMYKSPLVTDKLQRILDVGTGTGIWAIDMADDIPEVQVVGTDISPIQPSWVPPNVQFEIEDFTQEWTFAENEFDFVYMRYLYGSVIDWYDVFRNAYRVCKPGGWVESYEADPITYSDDGTLPANSALAEFGRIFHAGCSKLNRIFTPIPDHLQEKGMEAAGFVDIHVETMKVPVGQWPKDERLSEIGRFCQLGVLMDVEGHVSFMASLLPGWTQEHVHVYCAQLRKEMRAGKMHAYYLQRIVWGRKPE